MFLFLDELHELVVVCLGATQFEEPPYMGILVKAVFRQGLRLETWGLTFSVRRLFPVSRCRVFLRPLSTSIRLLATQLPRNCRVRYNYLIFTVQYFINTLQLRY